MMGDALIDPRETGCDRAAIVIARCVTQGWMTVHNRDMVLATIRLALDTEVRAGGPELDLSNKYKRALQQIEETLPRTLMITVDCEGNHAVANRD